MDHLRMQVLGTFAVDVDGVSVVDAFEYDKVRALLAYLAVEADRPHRRERLAGLLWPDDAEVNARGSLRSTLYRLRNAIHDRTANPPFLLITRQFVQLNPDASIDVDVRAFTAAWAAVEAHDHRTPATCAACVERLTKAVDLYGGDLLADFSLDSAEFEGWLVTRREGLHLQALKMLDWLARHHLDRGDDAAALDYARLQIELEPWREVAHRQLMMALASSGQRAAALAQFAACQHVLETELGIEPEAATVALYEQIRREDTQAAFPRTVTATVAASPVAPPIAPPAERRETEQHPTETPLPGGESMGERRVTSLVVADVQGAQALLAREGLEAWAETLHKVLHTLAAEVAQYGGTVLQTHDSGLVAAFGAEVAHEDDAERAVRTALAMAEALTPDRREDLSLSIGVMTDEAVVLPQQSGGVVVHAAALAQAEAVQAQVPPGTVWVSEPTYRRVERAFGWTWLSEARSGGHTVRLYRPVATVLDVRAEHDVGGLRAPLVGRQAELAMLTGAVARVRAGVGGIVTVVGEAGIGKSRLIAEARSRVNGGDGVRWIEGRWQSYTEEVAYAGWQEALRRLLELPDECNRTSCAALQEQVAALCPEQAEVVSPYLARLLALPLDAATAAKLDSLVAAGLLQSAIFQAVGEILACLTQPQPLVLVLEDLHWADAASLDLLESLMVLTDRRPLLLVAAMRPVRTHGCWRIQEAAVRDYGHRHTALELAPLSTDESNLLVQQLLRAGGGRAVGAANLTERIRKRAEGNPFFTAELVRSVLDREDHGDHVLPATVQGVLMARIDRLPAAARQVLHLAAVVGRVFRYRTLADLVIGPQVDKTVSGNGVLDAALLQLVRAQLIREQASVSDRSRAYIFDHQLTLEAAYGSLLERKRRALHRRVAEALERLYPEEVEAQLGLLAHHWAQAGDHGRAVEYLRRAGEQAAAQYANDAAVGHFTRALQLVPDDDLKLRYELLSARERVFELQGAYEAQAEDLAELRDVAVAMAGTGAEAAVAVRAAWWTVQRGDFVAALRQAKAAADLARRAGDVHSEAVAYLACGIALRARQDAHKAQALAYQERALELAKEAQLPSLEILSLCETAYTAMDLDQRSRAEKLLMQALRLSRDTGDRAGEGEALRYLGHMAKMEGDFDRVRAYAKAALQVQREIAHRTGEVASAADLAFAALWQGRYDAVQTHLPQALRLSRETGSVEQEIVALLMQGNLMRVLGVYDRALSHLQQAAQVKSGFINPTLEVWVWAELALLFMHLKDHVQAEAYATRALEYLSALEDVYYHAWLPNFRVVTLTILGYDLLSQERWREAAARFRRGVEEKLKTVTPTATMEARAGLAEALWRQGKMDAALAETEIVLGFIANHALESLVDPVRIYLTCYRVLAAADDPRADEVLAAGYDDLMRRAEYIDGEELRRSYLEKVEVNRELAATYHRAIEP